MEEPKRRKWMILVIRMGVQASDAKFKGPAGSLLLTVEARGDWTSARYEGPRGREDKGRGALREAKRRKGS